MKKRKTEEERKKEVETTGQKYRMGEVQGAFSCAGSRWRLEGVLFTNTIQYNTIQYKNL